MNNTLILGGTGTLGRAMVARLLKEDSNAPIIIFSRDELKQKQMAEDFKSSRLCFIIGDIRDKDSLRSAMKNRFGIIDHVFHFAALKHVDIGESNPEEYVKTNIIGTMNATEVAQEIGVRYFILSSTDKAVDPVNTYGMTKGLAERIMWAKNEKSYGTKYLSYRWGNVIGSRGSVIPRFIETLDKKRCVYITSKSMTRYWICIEDVADFILRTYKNDHSSQPVIPPIKGASLVRIINTLASLLSMKEYEYNVIVTGVRQGEKIHESLIPSMRRDAHTSLTTAQYTDEELTQLLAPFVYEYAGVKT